jgi:hypothetical protein
MPAAPQKPKPPRTPAVGQKRKQPRTLATPQKRKLPRIPDEYGFYIRQCFPIENDRRAYFQELVRTAVPHTGYRLLCHLAQADLVRSVWSPNFDGLTARAVAESA